jgi:hypothetical protein
LIDPLEIRPAGDDAMSDTPLDRLRRLSMALPEATEQEAWGAPTFRVRNRMFAMYAHDHHGDGRISAWINAPLGVQEMLVRHDPDTYFNPPYVGVKGWIGVILDNVTDDALHEHLVEAYCMVAPKKLQALVS